MEEPLTFSIGLIVLVAWGVGATLMGKHHYRGGWASVTGAFLIGAAIIAIARDYETQQLVFELDSKGSVFGQVGLIVIGILLMNRGHRKHKKVSAR